MNKKQFIERMVEHTDSPKGESRDWPTQEGCAWWQPKRASQECFGLF